MDWVFIVWVIGCCSIVVSVISIIRAIINYFRHKDKKQEFAEFLMNSQITQEILFQTAIDVYREQGRDYLQRVVKNVIIRSLNNGTFVIMDDKKVNGDFAESFSVEFIDALVDNIKEERSDEM